MGCNTSKEPDDDIEDEVYVDNLNYVPEAPLPQHLKLKYTVKSKLGIGAFSEVVRADHKETLEPFAIKIIKNGVSDTEDAAILTEIKILQSVDHENVIRVAEVFKSPEHTFIVMELATGGELFDRIVESGGYSEPEAARAMKMILDGVSYLHTHGICHRDLKPENILYYHPGPTARLLISDFGLAKMKGDDGRWSLKSSVGSPEYIAPEILRGGSYTEAVDMWSAGVICFILLGGYMPFDEPQRARLFYKIVHGKYQFIEPPWNVVTNEGRQFVQGLLKINAFERYSSAAALDHPWLKKFITPPAPVPMRRPLLKRKDKFEDLNNIRHLPTPKLNSPKADSCV